MGIGVGRVVDDSKDDLWCEGTRASLESGSGFWFIARDAAGNDKVSSRPGVELIRHGRALDDVVRGGALVHIA